MKKSEIRVGGLYLAKVAGQVTTVRVDAIREVDGYKRDTTMYDVTNLRTGRKTTFRSAAKFRGVANPKYEKCDGECGKEWPGANKPWTCTSCARAATGSSHNIPTDPQIRDMIDEMKKDAILADLNAIVQEHIELAPQEEEIGKEGEDSADPTYSESPTICSDDAVVTSANTAVSTMSATTPNYGVASPSRFAANLTASRTKRQVGTPVAGMVPNDEQEAILDIATDIDASSECGRVLVVVAGAGTGKTASLKMLEQTLTGNGQYTAYNAPLVAESKAKFVKAACNTTHSLAFRAVGKLYQHRLGGERMKSGMVARILGIEQMAVVLKGQGEPDEDGKPTDKTKTLPADWLAGQVMTALRKFMGSADREVGEHHFHYTDGIDVPTEDGKRGWTNNNAVRSYLLPFARKAWGDLRRVDGQLPFTHDCYVKIWQLGEGQDRPIIAADYILLDEAQDTAPVFLDILQQQKHAILVLVGDENQQIYEWRGAVNAMGSFPDAPRRLLNQSYRFGQVIADVANTILAELEEPTDLVMRGNPDILSRVDVVDEPRCYLYRTNAACIARLMRGREEGKRGHLIGKCDDIIAWCKAALDLQARPSRGTRHPELACFDDWKEVQEYSKTDEGGDLRLMVKLIDEFGAKDILEALAGMPKEEEADFVLSTAHRSKGREWPTVKLGGDFPTANKMTDADVRLLYVAATRAQHTLDVSECPPFCGAREFPTDPNSRWIPGLQINYTKSMPTIEEQEIWQASKHPVKPISQELYRCPECKKIRTDGLQGSCKECQSKWTDSPTDEEISAITAPKFTWAKVGDKWGVRGPMNTPIGTKVTVKRRDGSTSVMTVREVMYRNADTWIYRV